MPGPIALYVLVAMCTCLIVPTRALTVQGGIATRVTRGVCWPVVVIYFLSAVAFGRNPDADAS